MTQTIRPKHRHSDNHVAPNQQAKLAATPQKLAKEHKRAESVDLALKNSDPWRSHCRLYLALAGHCFFTVCQQLLWCGRATDEGPLEYCHHEGVYFVWNKVWVGFYWLDPANSNILTLHCSEKTNVNSLQPSVVLVLLIFPLSGIRITFDYWNEVFVSFLLFMIHLFGTKTARCQLR